MPRPSTYVRTFLSLFVLFWVVATELVGFVSIYSIAAAYTPLPPIDTSTVVTVVRDPIVLTAAGVLVAGTVGVARYRHGSLGRGILALLQWVLSAFGRLPVAERPDLEGRVRPDEAAWRVRYWAPERYEAVTRECPFCGRDLVSAVLPRHVVDGPNAAFSQPPDTRDRAAETFENVLGKEKYEKRGQVEAVECPQCNFAIPDTSEAESGKDEALSEFQRHVERMRSENPKDDPFATYRERAGRRSGAEPSPTDVWDAYAADAGGSALEIGSHDGDFGERSPGGSEDTSRARGETDGESVEASATDGGGR